MIGIDWGSLDESLTGKQVSGEDLLVAGIILLVGFVLADLIGRRVHIPNVEMLSKTVTVYTVDQLRRSAVEVTVGFESDIDHVEDILRQALDGLDEIQRVGAIRAQALTQGVQLSVRFWHPSSIREGNDAIDAAVRAIVATLADAAIRFAPATELSIVPDPGAPSEDVAADADQSV